MTRLRYVHVGLLSLFLMLLGGHASQLVAQDNSYLLWTKTGNANQPPQITSEPPPMQNRTYRYAVTATDADGDVLTFSLSNAPDGMMLDAMSGQLIWTASPDQIGNFTPTVTVADMRGATDSQTIPLTVTAEIFTTMTVAFLDGVNPHDGDTEQDNTVLSLGVGADMSAITDIVLPNMPTLLTFSDQVSFYVTYQQGQAVIVPEPEVTQIASEDTATGGMTFEAILADNLHELNWMTATEVMVTPTRTIVFQQTDGTVLKIGDMTLTVTDGTITLTYADITP